MPSSYPSPLEIGTEVFIFEMECFGKVIGVSDDGAQYIVEATAQEETVIGTRYVFMPIKDSPSFFKKVGSA